MRRIKAPTRVPNMSKGQMESVRSIAAEPVRNGMLRITSDQLQKSLLEVFSEDVGFIGVNAKGITVKIGRREFNQFRNVSPYSLEECIQFGRDIESLIAGNDPPDGWERI